MIDNHYRYSIKLKFLAIIIFVIIFVSSILGFFLVTKTKTQLIKEAEKRGISEVINLAYDAQYGILTEDDVILNHLINGRMRKPDTAYIIITLPDGKILADNVGDKYASMDIHKLGHRRVSIESSIDTLYLVKCKTLVLEDGEEIYEFTTKVKTTKDEEMMDDITLLSNLSDDTGPETLIRGFVKIGISLDSIHKEIMNTLFFSIAIIFSLSSLTLAISYYFTGFVVRPIKDVTDAAKEIAKGNLSTIVKISTKDEVGILASNFNIMTSVLNKTIEELRHLKIELEHKVQERTVDLKEANLRLKKANEELITLDQMKNEFIFTVSHDFRTPLASIVGFGKILAVSLKEEIINRLDQLDLSKEDNKKVYAEVVETQKFIQIIVNEGERLTRLINNMLDLSQLEANKMEWNNKYISFIDTVDFALSSLSFLIKEKRIKATVITDTFIPELFCDQDRLMQVLVNLLGNAIKFTNNGGKIKCLVHNRTTEIECKIRDSGIGINKNDLPAIFNKFKQIGNNLMNIPKGTGLGLPICKEIISHYGGKIWVDSTLGKGSTFTFILPVTGKDKDRLMADG